MATTIYKAKVRRDGALTMPKAMRERLRLHEGDEVEVAVSTPAVEAREENPLLKIIGIGKGGPKDGGVNHDKYLYGSDPM
jgi:AbrB family looped-hinge helix DNA binding protein